MMKNYMTMRTFARRKKPEGDSAGKASASFPEEKAIMSIYSGHPPQVAPQAQTHQSSNQ
jgi:hypothetical protein